MAVYSYFTSFFLGKKEYVKLVLCNLPQKSIATKIVPRLPKKKMRDANDYTVGLVYIVGK